MKQSGANPSDAPTDVPRSHHRDRANKYRRACPLECIVPRNNQTKDAERPRRTSLLASRWHQRTRLNDGDVLLPSERFTAFLATRCHVIGVNRLHNRGEQGFQESRSHLLTRSLPLEKRYSGRAQQQGSEDRDCSVLWSGLVQGCTATRTPVSRV